MLHIVWLTALVLIVSVSASAQSFDCRLARFSDEIAICHHTELGRLDEQLAEIFNAQRSRVSESERRRLTVEQSGWLKVRRQCGGDRECLKRRYEQRLAQLSGGRRRVPSFTREYRYDGKRPIRFAIDEIEVFVTKEPTLDGSGSAPIVTAQRGNSNLFTLKIGENGREEPEAKVLVMRLDPYTKNPQVVLTYFWGGAHCCTVTKIATTNSNGRWHEVSAPTLDADGFDFIDLDTDGSPELVGVDNSFLYAFASYAESGAPPIIFSLRGSELMNTTRDSRFKGYLQKQLRQMERSAAKEPRRRKSNGWLAGWVATKALLGEFDAAWRFMLTNYDRESDWTLEECATGASVDQCPSDKIYTLTFPDALQKHLKRHGYIWR